jgi:hypothetical protein
MVTFVPRSRIERIRDNIRLRQYDMSAHAMEELAEDDLDVEDVERAILTGTIVRIEREDPRGTKYVIHGLAVDGITLVGAVGRFTSTGRFLIITTYEVTEPEE